MHKHFFFDLDGTLVDSYPATICALQKIIKEDKGIDVSYDELFLDCMVCIPYLIEKQGLDNTTYDRLHYMLDNDKTLPPIEDKVGMKDVLKLLKERCYNVYTYTNRNEKTLEICKDVGMDKYIDGHIINAHKPDPTTLLDFLNEHNLNKEECLVIGDRLLDVEGGRNAGVDGFSIYDYKPEPIAIFQSEDYKGLLKLLNLSKISGVLFKFTKDHSKNKLNRLIVDLNNKGITNVLMKKEPLSTYSGTYLVVSDSIKYLDEANELGFISVGINDTYGYNKANIRIEEFKDLIDRINKLNSIIK